MVNEVNKIIRNALLTGGGKGVFLPGIGSLTLESRAAVRSSRKTLEPPHKTVVFHEREIGVSVIDEIARQGVDAEQAHEVYNEWRVTAFSEGVVTIAGVGVINDDQFTIDNDFAAYLNPQGTRPVAIAPKSDKLLYVFAALCCLFAVCVAGYIWYGNQEKPEKPQFAKVETKPIEVVPAAAVVTEEQQSTAEETAEQTTEEKTENTVEAVAELPKEEAQKAVVETPKPQPQSSDKGKVQRSVSGCSYLILGIFSTEENAFKAVANAERIYPAADCRVYNYSDKFMVSLFESTDSKACVEYQRSVSELFRDTWVYTKR